MKDRLSELVDQVYPVFGAIEWIPSANFHITTKFIGHTNPGQMTLVQDALLPVSARSPFAISIGGLSLLPNWWNARTFGAGVHGEELKKLAAQTNAALASVGVPPEIRKFRPHVTLARIEARSLLVRERSSLRDLVDEFGAFTVEAFHLYRSDKGAHGSEYSILKTYYLV